jgi:ADP-ribosyl-[dinitrogen reductase] hydrolase
MGAWLGLAVGDALGAPIQFMERDSYAHVTGYSSGGRYDLQPGYWTDDTSMALCLAESLIEKSGYDPHDFGERLVRWVGEGYNSSLPHCFDIGKTTLRAIGNIRRDGAEASGISDENSCGNGSIMRLSPVPIFFRMQPNEALKVSLFQGQITHAHGLTSQACVVLCTVILAALKHGTKEAVFSALATSMVDPAEELLPIIKGRFRELDRDKVRSDTYVISTLEASLWSVWNTDNFSDAMLLAVNLGHDADTVGAVTGQIAGAIYGLSGIPKLWVNELTESKRLLEIGELLCGASLEK